MDKKKIAFVVMRYGLEVNGGAELLCRMMAERLTDLYEVDVITSKAVDHLTWADKYKDDTEELNGVRVLRFSVDFERDINEFGKRSDIIFDRSRIHTIKDEEEWIKSQGPYSTPMFDYISSHKDDYHAFLFVTYLFPHAYFGVPLVQDKAILIPCAHDEPPIYLKAYRGLFNAPVGIFYNTVSEKELVNRVTLNTSVYDNEGHGGAGIELKEDTVSVNRDERIGSDDYIIYVGRIEPAKGCGELFEFYSKYKKKAEEN